MTNTTKIKAVKQVFLLVKNGTGIQNARKIVGEELHVTPSTVYNWERKFGKTTKSATTTTRTNHQSPLQISNYSFNDMSNDIRGVLKSVVNQDGRYTTREAGVIGKLYGAELTKAKLLLEVHKHNIKVSSDTNHNNILSLS